MFKAYIARVIIFYNFITLFSCLVIVTDEKTGNLVTSNWLWKHNELDTLVIVFKDDVQIENSRDEVLTTYQLNYMFVQTIHFWRSLCHYCLRLVKVALNFNTNLKFVQFVVDQNSNVLIISRAMSKGFRDFISFFQIFCLKLKKKLK